MRGEKLYEYRKIIVQKYAICMFVELKVSNSYLQKYAPLFSTHEPTHS